MPEAELVYVGDPMCFWCWGFAPAFRRAREEFGGRLSFRILLGGLYPGVTARRLDPAYKEELADAWPRVAQATGQAFHPGILERRDFLWDTEPACRSVVAARQLAPAGVFEYHEALQRAFFRDNRDPTETGTFVAVAQTLGLDAAAFERKFHSIQARKETLADFQLAQSLGVEGFPCLLLGLEGESETLAQGCLPYEELKSNLEMMLNKAS